MAKFTGQNKFSLLIKADMTIFLLLGLSRLVSLRKLRKKKWIGLNLVLKKIKMLFQSFLRFLNLRSLKEQLLLINFLPKLVLSVLVIKLMMYILLQLFRFLLDIWLLMILSPLDWFLQWSLRTFLNIERCLSRSKRLLCQLPTWLILTLFSPELVTGFLLLKTWTSRNDLYLLKYYL